MAREIVFQALHGLFGIVLKLRVNAFHQHVRTVGRKIHCLGRVHGGLGRHAGAVGEFGEHELSTSIFFEINGRLDEGVIKEIFGGSHLLHSTEFIQGACRIARRLHQTFDKFARFIVFALAKELFSFDQPNLTVVGIKFRPDLESLISRFFVVCFLRNVKGASRSFGRAAFLRCGKESLPCQFRVAGLHGEFTDEKTADDVGILRGLLGCSVIGTADRVGSQRGCGVNGG